MNREEPNPVERDIPSRPDLVQEASPSVNPGLPSGPDFVRQASPFANRLVLLPTLALAFLVVLVLFGPLFLDASLLSVDNRITNPFLYHVGEEELPRPMNVDSIDINAFIMPEALLSSLRWKAGELPLWNDCQVLGQP